MRLRRLLGFTAVAVLTACGGQAVFADSDHPDPVSIAVGRWLEQGHFTRQPLDESMSRKLLETYLVTLDGNHLYFTRQDVDGFRQKYGDSLGDYVLRGDMTPARDMFSVFKHRVEDREAANKQLALKKFTFDENRTVARNREKADWPKDQAEADALWHDWIEADLLEQRLNDQDKSEAATKAVIHRCDSVVRDVREMDDSEVVKTFLTSLAQSYDPHSEYMSRSEMDDFYIDMKLSLVGVGAVLSTEEGYPCVKEVVPGGPAALDGHLKVNDRIAGVAQGNGPFEDVVDMRIDQVVEKIRGRKGSTVRLQIIPVGAVDPGARKIIAIKRDEVKLKGQEATAQVLDLKQPDGGTVRVGWITLPEFYANMDDDGSPKSTTEDVKALLGRLKKEKIQGLVMDLRLDPGGSLEEAIDLTGLFVGKRAVVQEKDTNGEVTISTDTDYGQAYNGPMVVLTNRLSASASEIFAAALQDYGRAVIVGDHSTFGKGTVQTLLDMKRDMPFFGPGAAQAGGLKLTIQKFYRVSGGSTQLKGVASDLVLPSLTDSPDVGEGALRNFLGYDEVPAVGVKSSGVQQFPSLFLDELRRRSAARVVRDPEFAYIEQDLKRQNDEISNGNALSLNESARKRDLATLQSELDAREKDRAKRGPAIDVTAYGLTLEDAKDSALKPVAYIAKPEEADSAMDDGDAPASGPWKPEPDPIKDESLRIIGDLISLNRPAKVASAQSVHQEAPQ